MVAQLRRLGPNSKIKILKVPDECRSKIWLAGRGTCCQIYTKSKYASRQHFSITYRDQKYFISDLQSANGTFLDDEKLTCEKLLTFGSVISVGVPSQMQNVPDCIVYVFESSTEPEEKSLVIPENAVKNIEPENKDLIMHLDIEVKTSENHRDSTDLVQTVLNDSSSSDVVFIEAIHEPEKRFMDWTNEPNPSKKVKLEKNSGITLIKHEERLHSTEETNSKPEEIRIDDDDDDGVNEDISAYEALTQVDESQIKPEPDLLNYSLTEELIEISDSEDGWCPGLKQEGSSSPQEDEDDDVVFIQTIKRDPCNGDLFPVDFKPGDDMTETDLKWMGKLMKVKKEADSFTESEEVMEIGKMSQTNEDAEAEELEQPERPEPSIHPCTVGLSRLDVQSPDQVDEVTEKRTPPVVEAPQKEGKRIRPKKSVTFNLVPMIKYIEAPSGTRLTPSEIGKIRFTRIIYNICNWNTHWLEECKRVAPEKDPPDICEERLRKIPKKFFCHSDYMKAFIPPMLLHLWNKMKDKWIASGESGFRQPVSCDSYEDYHAENLQVYKCTGLVRSVEAHKQLLREGHLVMLRLHQIQVPQSTTPASEKYSKKLGYLVFGFVESKTYEQYHKQPLHGSLAEMSASVAGELHVVRLRILVKKRPNFKLDRRKLIQLTVVQQITQELRLFRGICLLPDSPLCSAILKPSKIEFPLVEPGEISIRFKGPIDEVQSDIVRKLSHACSSTSSLLYSVFGAAGTGKGQVIIALILQLLFGNEWRGRRPKIVFCTQWSIPLDEMVVKLKSYRQATGESFSLVRVGPIREVKPEVRDLCLSNLASNLRNSNKRGPDERRIEAEMEVIKEADVICTTCISAGIAQMCSAFEKLLMRDRERKVVCIMDEAMSSREADSVVPLLLGVTHLILVGDIYQLEPTFSGEKTNSLGLDTSLFWRIYRNVMNIPKELWPIFILKTQYRASSGLSDFTSNLIYKTALQKPSVGTVGRIANIKSHLLLVDRTPEKLGKEEKEIREVRIVCQLTKAVTKLAKAVVKTVRIAVITCDTKQTESLQSSLPKTEFPGVEIDKIQAFQGREFDLVIFSYDGKKVLTSWLATALTRAKGSLFIFASEHSIKVNPFFQKISEYAEKCSVVKYVRPEMTCKDFEEIARAV